MPYRSWQVRRAKPRTYAGQFLRATFLHQQELRDELGAKLNGGRPGWNDDEPAVVDFACRLVLRRFFGNEYSALDIADFVDFTQAAAAGDALFDRLQAEAVVREALGETGIDAKGIGPARKFVLRYTTAGLAALRLGLGEDAADEIIVDSERMAFDQGWKPPLIRGKSSGVLS
jgi:hypothetical protein